MSRYPVLVLLVVGGLSAACAREDAATTEAAPAHQTATAEATLRTMQTSRPQAGLGYDLPANWNRVAPSSSMRLDQATIPGDAGDGELAVFFFGSGGGGGVEANLDRWQAQMQGASEPVRETFEVGSYTVTWLDVSGTLQPSMTGMGPSDPEPSSRMFAAVVQGEGGPWFFKATGPEATMASARDQFISMLHSVRPPSA